VQRVEWLGQSIGTTTQSHLGIAIRELGRQEASLYAPTHPIFQHIVTVALAATLTAAQGPAAQPVPVEYKAGQSWRYATGDSPTITILKVEDLPKIGRVIHVRVDNIPVPGCAGIHLTNSIDHIALTEKMMRKSANDLLRENTDLPDAYFEGYREWQKQKKPQIVKDITIADVLRRNADLPLICNFLPATTA
jgi:hypothetical protein